MIRISELRKIRHLSQKEFGTLFQVSQNTVSQWERGHRGMDPDDLRTYPFIDISLRIAAVFYRESLPDRKGSPR
ncbi:MAG TPA: helix-turn-helix transcriptional regulator [Clostridia bacterium]